MMPPLPVPPRRQHGIVLVLFTVGALAIVAVAGLALDLGLAYLARTRLQNALDAAALSGAKTLNKTFDEDLALSAAQATYNLNKAGLVASVTPLVELSPTLSPFVAGGANPRFVRVSVASMPSPLLLASVLPGVGSSIALGGAAVAGPIPLGGEVCNAIPVALCGVSGDSDCSDRSCFGFPSGEFEIKGDNTSLGPGNYGLVMLGCAGADCVRTNMAGGGDFCFDPDGSVTTEPGTAAGPTAQGLNTRFNIYQGPVSPAEYPGDVVTVPALSYDGYTALLGNSALWNNPGGVPQRRVVPAPVIDCSVPINGRQDVSVLGTACLFLTKPVIVVGGDGTIYAEVAPECFTEGEVEEAPGESSAYEIVLYQNVPGA